MNRRGLFGWARRGLEKASDVLSIWEGTDPFGVGGSDRKLRDPYRQHAWVNICVGLLMRNVARAEFTIRRRGREVTSGPIWELFRDVNPRLNRFALWKETSAWWYLEGEAFWWFGENYRGGVPTELYVLSPRRMRHQVERGRVVRWTYQSDMGEVPLLPDEIVHFRDWNPWNEFRGVNPLIALTPEIEQDFQANRANTELLRNDAIPRGLLKTEQTLREEEAALIERVWEQKYGRAAGKKSVAVLGKGTEFQTISFSPELVQFFDLKRWNLYTILAKYGIPPRVAGIQDAKGGFTGKDTEAQHQAFWKYQILPALKNFEQILDTEFFGRLGLVERGVFNVDEIPELQESQREASARQVREIEAGLVTINDVIRSRGGEEKPWGDVWYRPQNLIPTNGTNSDLT